MATQNMDGTWSEVEPLPEALKTLRDQLETGTARRFVVGSEQEIEEEKSKIDLEDKMSELTDRLDMVEARQDQSWVKIPTAAEVLQFTG